MCDGSSSIASICCNAKSNDGSNPSSGSIGRCTISAYTGNTAIKFFPSSDAENRKKFVSMALIIALGAFGLSAALFAGRLILEYGFGIAHYEAHVFLSPLQKLPPGPVYFLSFAACAFLWLWILARYSHVRVIHWYSAAAEVIGRNSLFVFIVQYFVYFTILPWAGFNFTGFWPIYFVVSVIAIWMIAFAWDVGKRRGLLSRVKR